MNFRWLSILLPALILSACSQPAGISSMPIAPVSTGLSATVDSIQPAIAASTKKIGTPVPGWEDIPIMPGAYDPELTDIVYLYTVDTLIDQVEEYYQAKLKANGWTLTNRQELNAGPTGGPSTVLDYQKNDRLLNIMLVNMVEQKATSVILSQLAP
jgi:hypothetical protein